MHGMLTGRESRQQLYTMLTRGRHANHLYLRVVGDGDPHNLIRPDTVAPPTPTETLHQILVRDDSPTSATTTLRELHDPAARLHGTVQRYTDSLHAAAEHLIGPERIADLEAIDHHIPGLTDEPAWPTLRAHLLHSPPKPANTPSATSKKRPAAATSPPPATWPPSSTGDYPPPQATAMAHSPGSLESRRNYEPTRPGVATSPDDHNLSPSSPSPSELSPRNLTAGRPGSIHEAPSAPNCSATSPSGAPRTASTRKT